MSDRHEEAARRVILPLAAQLRLGIDEGDVLIPAFTTALRQAEAAGAAREREACAKVADTEEEADGEPDQAIYLVDPIDLARASIRATKKSIARRIRSRQSPEGE